MKNTFFLGLVVGFAVASGIFGVILSSRPRPSETVQSSSAQSPPPAADLEHRVAALIEENRALKEQLSEKPPEPAPSATPDTGEKSEPQPRLQDLKDAIAELSNLLYS